MNLIDILLILIIIFSGVVGLKRGFFKELVLSVGAIAVFIGAFYLKDIFANFLTFKLPLYSFGILKDYAVLNILFYQIIGFLVALGILFAIFRLIIWITGALEMTLKFTVIFGIISKIFGAILGLAIGCVYAFFISFCLRYPFLREMPMVEGSKFKDGFVNNMPFFNSIANNTLNLIDDIDKVIKDKRELNEKNLDILELMLKYKVIDGQYVEKLEKTNKFNVEGMEHLIYKYEVSKKI